MTKNMSDSPESIIKRLEKLRQWQEEQEKILIERQSSQREILNQEQQRMYSLLGISKTISPKETIEVKKSPSNGYINLSKIKKNSILEEGISLLDQSESITLGTKGDAQHAAQHINADEKLPPKRPYLKRGQGLTNRFKIDPDALRLDNLPKYKYTNSHKKFLQNKNNKNPSNKEKQNKNKLKLKNKETSINIRANSKSVSPQKIQKSIKEQELSTSDFIKSSSLLLKQNSNKRDQISNNPEILETYKDVSHSDNKIQISHSVENINTKKSPLQLERTGCNNSEETQSTCTTAIDPISWAQVLNTENPIPIQQFRNNSIITTTSSLSSEIPTKSEENVEQNDSVSLFELLEKRAENSSISLDISKLRKWIESKSKLIIDSKDEIDLISIENIRRRISPVPFDIENKIILDESEDNDSDNDDNNDNDDNDEDDNSNDNGDSEADNDEDEDEDDEEKNSEIDEEAKVQKGHVRFSDDIQINELESDTDTILSNEIETISNSKTSTPTDKILFEQFKTRLFAGENKINSDDNDDDTINGEKFLELTLIQDQKIIDEKKKEIFEKTELLKSRLVQLEEEISTFKEHNTELIKLKQQHELDKIQIEQERIEMKEKLNDEKIKMEIYLHDERMKIEEEKKKLDKLISAQKIPNRKEREEITKLKEQVENLQKENRNKENRHVAAQSRLRAQMRILEKEVKDLNFEREHLKKEIKKLESENSRLHRMNNNKMLQEINKTISKLAPKAESTEVNNKNAKPVTAKAAVSSHQRKQLNLHKNIQSKSVPNLCCANENDLTTTTTDEEESEENDDDDDDDDDVDGDSSSETIKSDMEEQSQYLRKNISKSKNNTKRKTKRKRSKGNIEDKIETKNEDKATKNNKCIKDLSREIINTDGSKDIWYPNGNLKKISSDGMIIKMLYYNKDIKETNITEGTVKYYYAETNTWHTTYLDGLEILEFPNGQTEHRYKDGTIEVHFPNGSIRISNPTDEKKSDEWRYPDGTTLVHLKNGDKILSMPNGQKEIHTKLQKRREYPDGTVKIVYPDGSQETRYSNGRVRLKDKFGNLVMDSEDSNY